MADVSKRTRIEEYINDIISTCQTDSTKLEVAIVNFRQLLETMNKYERSPKYFNSLIEDVEKTYHTHTGTSSTRRDEDQYAFPVVSELESIYGKKLKQTELQALGTQLATKTGLRLERETKRSKNLLLQWFYRNWTTLKPKIFEFNLHTMNFSK